MKFLFLRQKKEKGSIALLLTFLILNVMLIIIFGLSNIFIGQLKTSAYINRSAPALYAADAGAEFALYEYSKEAMVSGSETSVILGSSNASFDVTWDYNILPSDPDYPNWIISNGNYLNIIRRITIQ